MRWQKLYNPIVSWLLRSSLHSLMSGSTMLITFSDHKSGKTYTTPVNYVWDDHTLVVVSPRSRLWWRNLRAGAPVRVYVRGRRLKGVGRAFEGEEAVEEGGLLTVIRKVPAYQRYWRVELDEKGQPKDEQELLRVAQSNALVRIVHLTLCRELWRQRQRWMRKPSEIAQRVYGSGGFWPTPWPRLWAWVRHSG